MPTLFKRKPTGTPNPLNLPFFSGVAKPNPVQAQPIPQPAQKPVEKPAVPNTANDISNPAKNDPLFLQKRVSAQIEQDNPQAAQMQADVIEQNKQLTQSNDAQIVQQQTAQRQQDIQQAQGQAQPESQFQLGQGSADMGANVLTNIPSIAAGAVSGAAIGAIPFLSVPTAGLSVVAGAIIGGVSTFFGKLAIDRHQATKEALKLFTKASITRNTEILNMAHAGVSPAKVLQAYDQNLANIHESERELKSQTRTAIGRQLSGAMDELIQVEFYLNNEDFHRQELLTALSNPNPAAIQNIQETDITDSGA